jgi:hypothetical protein
MSGFDALRNLGLKATRRLQAAPKPFVRAMRRRAREAEHRGFRRDAGQAAREIARVAQGRGPILVGPWLAEVGYEVLYWIPFLRWFQDAHGVGRDRLVVLSRGGLDGLYGDLAGTYIDLFDLLTPEQLAARNAERRADREGGGQKQSDVSPFDTELAQAALRRAGLADATVLHPSLMFRLFRHVWYGNLPLDLLWRHVRHELGAPAAVRPAGLPDDYIAVKFYAGPALSTSEPARAAVRRLVEQASRIAPVVVLDTDLKVDEHRDLDLSGIPGTSFLGARMTPRDNLGLQVDVVRGARFFLGTCGGLAWLAPFLGVPTVAVYDDDALLTMHLLVARQAGGRVGAAEFAPLDLRAVERLGLLDALHGLAAPRAARIE